MGALENRILPAGPPGGEKLFAIKGLRPATGRTGLTAPGPAPILRPRQTARNRVPRPMNTRYNAADIEVLSGLDPVKRRPGMYTDTTRPNHLAQVIDNSVDEAWAATRRRSR